MTSSSTKAGLLALATLLGGTAAVTLPAAAQARTVLSVQVGPPAPRVEVVPAPRPGHVWVPGYYVWQRRAYVWRHGYWVADRPGYAYVAPVWVQDGSRWVYRPARWDRHPGPPPVKHRPPKHRDPRDH